MSCTFSFARRVSFPLLLGLMLLPLGCKKEEESEAGEEEHAAPVKWEKAEKVALEEWTELLGTTQPLPSQVAHVSAAISGYVVSVLPSEKDIPIEEGQRVKKGQVLVRLDDRVVRANRQKLLAADPELHEQTKQAQIAKKLARIEIDRLERLQRNSGGSVPLVTRLEMDKAQEAHEDAQSKFDAAQAKQKVAEAERGVFDEELALYTMKSPIDGQLGLVHAQPGQTLTVGTTIATVVNLDKIDVLCFVPARTASLLKLKQRVRIEEPGGEISADKSKVEEGRIVFISNQAQAETGTVAVKARFPNLKRNLRANTLVRIRVLTREKPNCFSIPESALLEDQEEPGVLIVEAKKKKDKDGKEMKDKDGKDVLEYKVERLQAKVGIRDRIKQRVEILGLVKVEEKEKKEEALEDDLLFVTEGGHGLEEDDLVTLKKEEEHEEHKDEHKEDKKDEPKEEKKDEK